MDKVPEWNGTPGMLHFTVDGEPQSLMVTPFASKDASWTDVCISNGT